jgi:hypothetical protein
MTAPPTSRPSREAREQHSWLQRLDGWGPWLLLGLGLTLQTALQIRWIRLDGRVGAAVFCEMVTPVVELVNKQGAGQLAAYFSGDHPIASFDLAAILGRALFGPGPDFLLYTVLVFAVGAQLLLFDLGRKLAGPWAGALAALLLLLYPDPGSMVRRWAPQIPQMFLLLAAAACLIRSRSLSRTMPSLGFALFAAIGASFSIMTTHNLLFMLAAGGMAMGAAGRGLLLGRGPLGDEPVSRWRVALGVVVCAGLVALTAWALHFAYVGLGYYGQELTDESYNPIGAWWHWRSLTAYVSYHFQHAFGPFFGLVALAGLGVVVRRGEGRAELMGWLLVPLVLLSCTTKKNWYYLSVIYPLVPLFTALGIELLPWRRLRLPLMAAVLVPAWALWQHASFQPDLGRGPVAPPEPSLVFQSAHVPSLQPLPRFALMRESMLLRTNLPGDSCPAGIEVCAEPQPDDFVNAILVLSDLDPCIRHDRKTPTNRCDWLVYAGSSQPGPPPGGSAHPRADPTPPPRLVQLTQEEGFELVDRDTMQEPTLWLLHNPDPERERPNHGRGTHGPPL